VAFNRKLSLKTAGAPVGNGNKYCRDTTEEPAPELTCPVTFINKKHNRPIPSVSARNGNLEVPVYVLQTRQGYTIRKMEETMDIIYIDK
jgi:hypothetical protein